MTEQPNRICILGGGFGGLYTALRLSQLPWMAQEKPEVVLVDRSDRFLFSPLLYELMTGELQTWEIAPLFQDLLAGTEIRFHQASVADIDLQAKRIRFHVRPETNGPERPGPERPGLEKNTPEINGPEMAYSHLVLAMGGETPLDRVPGTKEYALPFRTIANAHCLEDRLRVLERSDTEKIRVAIVGGGYSGVELACKLAERLQDRGRIRLIEQADQILRTSPEFNRAAAMKALSDRGVWLDLATTLEEITAYTISLTYKETTDTIPVDIVLWTVGTRVAEVIQPLPLKKNQRGQLVVMPTLQTPDYPEVFALGDLVDGKDADDHPVPATAQSAIQQADYVGWNLWASITGRPLLSFRYQHLGEMMTLGTDNATMAGLGLKLDGSLAAIARRLVYLYRMPTLDHQIRVGLSWISQPMVSILENLAKQ